MPTEGPVSRQAQSPLAKLAEIGFRDRSGALRNFEAISKRVPAGISGSIPLLLSDLPDPDGALNAFERLTESAGAEALRLLDRHRPLIHYALAVFAYSRFLGETLIQNPDLFQIFQRERNLDRSYSREDYREAYARFSSRSFDTDISKLLSRFKRREFVRIMLRDVLGISTLAETTNEISALADVLIEEALRDCESHLLRRYGKPQHLDSGGRLVDSAFAVVALGKLGGSELNYSSDIDLLFLFGDGERDESDILSDTSNREYFIRLAQQVTDVLSRVTSDGFVFRIDLRLRPQGREGEPAVSLSHALHYYSGVARDWELQAMIKLRHAAGDVPLARRFIRGVQPYVYTDQINFEAIETALEARDRIQERKRQGGSSSEQGIDVKLDRGGIRDIEFLVQCLQRVYGGTERWLRSGSTLFSLQKLHDKRHLSGADFHKLTTSYEFLRQVEHRLQLRQGQQTHRLPTNSTDVEMLRRSLSEDPVQGNRPAEVTAMVRERMAEVSEVYNRIIHNQQSEPATTGLATYELELEPGREHSDLQMLQRLAADSPALYEIAKRPELPNHVRRDLFRFLSSALTSPDRFEMVAGSPQAMERALCLFGTSELLTDLLIRHPEEIAVLDQQLSHEHKSSPRTVSTDSAKDEEGENVLRQQLLLANSEAEQWSLLRRKYRHQLFVSGARDVLEGRDVYDSLRETSSAADEVITAALAIAGQPRGLGIFALGRLGTSEFDVLSDADLIFIRDAKLSVATANRTAEVVMDALSAYTREGTVLAVDARLRPHGKDGDLTVTPEQLGKYFENEAQTWEALTYAKLRFVAGAKSLEKHTVTALDALRVRFSTLPDFGRETRRMRRRLEQTDLEELNFKTGAGGLYDIDFIVSYLSIRSALRDAGGNLEERLTRLESTNSLSSEQGRALARDGRFLRTLEHVIRLVTGRTGKTLPVAEVSRQSTEELTGKILGRSIENGIENELRETLIRVREVYDELLTV